MEIKIADERLLVLEERLTIEEIRQRAHDKRTGAFGGGIGGLLQRPKPEEVVATANQRRLEPFWHVAGHSRYEYQRSRNYTVPLSGPEVRQVNVAGTDYPVSASPVGGSFAMPVLEHCVEELRAEHFIDGRTGETVADGATAIAGPRREVADIAELGAAETLVVPAEQRASFVVRGLIAELMKPIQADRLIEEQVVLDVIDLCFRPVWAFEYRWQPRDRTGALEIDGLTGQVRQTNALLPMLKSIMADKDTLFDIGVDTVELFVPGANIAMKVARVVAERNRKR